MLSYKTPVSESISSSSCFAGVVCSPVDKGGDCAHERPASEARAAQGREAPLDLIEEHLTYTNHETEWRQGFHGGALLKNWSVPVDWNGYGDREERFILKVQPFARGGYEATVRKVNLERIGSVIELSGIRGKREAPEEPSVENQLKAAARAKRKMRYLVKNMMADHLVTFTKREAEGSDYWTPDQWAVAWDRCRRLLTKVIGEFPYVAILEKHAKGNYHLHVAWVGRVSVGIVRKVWLAVIGGGKGCGNIDAKHIKVQAGGDRSSRIARYISKYVGKHFEDAPRYNKKRYWASRQTLEEARRYVLNADTLQGALETMRVMLGLDYGKFMVLENGRLRPSHLFMFPNQGGVWLEYIPELHGVDPPF